MNAPEGIDPSPERVVINDAVFEAVAVPFVLMAALHQLRAEAEELDLKTGDLDGLKDWPDESRARYVEKVAEDLTALAVWIDEIGSRFSEAVSP